MYLEFEDFLFNCESKGLSPKTIKSYRNNTALFLKFTENELGINNVKEIQNVHVKRYFKYKSDNGCSNVYINSIHKVLRAFFQYCQDEEYIINNPMLKLKFSIEEKKIIDIFNDDEVRKDEKIIYMSNSATNIDKCLY